MVKEVPVGAAEELVAEVGGDAHEGAEAEGAAGHGGDLHAGLVALVAADLLTEGDNAVAEACLRCTRGCANGTELRSL